MISKDAVDNRVRWNKFLSKKLRVGTRRKYDDRIKNNNHKQYNIALQMVV
jgi:hypothetical protein